MAATGTGGTAMAGAETRAPLGGAERRPGL